MITFNLPLTKIKVLIMSRTWFEQNWLVKKYRTPWIYISKTWNKDFIHYLIIKYPTKETFRKHKFEIHEASLFPKEDNYYGSQLNWE